WCRRATSLTGEMLWRSPRSLMIKVTSPQFDSTLKAMQYPRSEYSSLSDRPLHVRGCSRWKRCASEQEMAGRIKASSCRWLHQFKQRSSFSAKKTERGDSGSVSTIFSNRRAATCTLCSMRQTGKLYLETVSTGAFLQVARTFSRLTTPRVVRAGT